MNRSHICRAILFSAAITVGGFASSVRAGDLVDNPKYQAWAKFKEGSTNTVAADIVRGPNTIHVETKKTLISVAPDNVVVETVTTAQVMGHDNAQPATRETINAKTDQQDFKQTGEKDVEALGKTFKCKVYEATGPGNSPLGGRPGAAAAAGNKATVYASDDVPGGLVKLEVTGGNGIAVTFVLTAMEAK